MDYLIEGLDPAPFAPLFAQSDAALAQQNIVAVYAEDDDHPCRISLAGAARGDRLLLLNHVHQPAASPYRASHAIYVAQGSTAQARYRNVIAPVMRTRPLSIRAFDNAGMIVDADLVDGADAERLIHRLLADPRAAYLQVHFARRGCFAATVTRG